MKRTKTSNPAAVEPILRDYLARRKVLHLEGVGDIRLRDTGEFDFEPESGPRVFIGYASEDVALSKRLSRQLRAAGFRPWLDREQLVPGQNWPRAIERAIQSADFAIQCFSTHSIGRRGFFHKELRLVLESATRVPFEEVYLLPIRFEKCALPDRVTSQYQYVDLFPDWTVGVDALIDVIAKQHARRHRRCDTT